MRATSPAKTYSDLELLNKPVTYSVTDVMRDDLPEGISVLIEDPQVLCENVGIIPSKIQVRWSTHRAARTDRTGSHPWCEEAPPLDV